MSNKRVQFRRGTTAEHTTTGGGFTGAAGEVTVDTTNTSIRVHDNSTAGGIETARADLSNISPSSSVAMNSQRITGVADPVDDQDVATKAYVSTFQAGSDISALNDVSVSSPSSGDLFIYDGSDSWDNKPLSGHATINAAGALSIATGVITSTHILDGTIATADIADNAITQAKLSGASVLTVTDGSTGEALALGGTVTFEGTANETTVSQSGGTVTVGLPDDVTVAATLTVSGNLIVSGTQTTVNTATVSIADNIMTLNSDVTGTPSENAGIEVERGDSANTVLRWNETSDEWEVTPDGTNYYEIAHSGNANSVTTAMITDANVTTAKIAGDAITNAKLADDAVQTENVADAAITTALLANASVTTAKIPNNAVTNTKIIDDAISTAKIADSAVTAAKLSFLTGTIDGTGGQILVGNDSSAFAQVALSGDVTLAANGATTIANSAVETAMINDSAVTTAKINDDAVTTDKILDANVTTAKITDANVTTAKIADANVTTAKIADANVTAAKIASNAVTTAKIAAANVVTDSIADSNITTAKINNSAVTTVKILDGNVTTAKIADANVTTAKIADDNITTAKIAANAITTTEITDANVTTAKLANNAVTVAKIALIDNTVVAGDTKILIGDGSDFSEFAISGDATMSNAGVLSLVDNCVGADEIGANVITNAHIADGTITPEQINVFNDSLVATTSGHFLVTNGTSFANVAMSGDATLASNGAITIGNDKIVNAYIAAGAVTTTEIGADAVTAAKLADDSVVTANIVADAVTSAKIADNAVLTAHITDANVTTTKLAADAVTSAKILNANVTSAKIADANVTTGKIADANVTTAKIADTAVTTAKIANNAVTGTQLNSSVAGAGLSGGGGSSLSINVDDSTIEINGGGDIALKADGIASSKIKDDAIVTAKIANANVTTAKIASAAVTTSLLADSNVTTAKVADNAITQDKLSGSAIVTLAADSGTADGVALGETLSIIGTSDEIETAVGSNQIQIGLPNNVNVTDLNVLNDLQVTSDFGVTGLLTMNNGANTTTFTHANGISVQGAVSAEGKITAQAVLETQGAVTRKVLIATTNTTLNDTHHVVFATGNNSDITLPSASANTGREYIIRNRDSSSSVSVSVVASGGNVSDSSIGTNTSMTFISDGTDWWSF